MLVCTCRGLGGWDGGRHSSSAESVPDCSRRRCETHASLGGGGGGECCGVAHAVPRAVPSLPPPSVMALATLPIVDGSSPQSPALSFTRLSSATAPPHAQKQNAENFGGSEGAWASGARTRTDRTARAALTSTVRVDRNRRVNTVALGRWGGGVNVQRGEREQGELGG
jgi:hypothetical protein